jgi:glycosyltransferase involved in cell wall biosynthesis
MILGIDAANIRRGGGVTHLVELLRAVDPRAHGFSQVIVWSGRATLAAIEDRPWLVKSHHPALDKALLHRAIWQRFSLVRIARRANCDVLFVPGGSFAGYFHPIVTMSQNLLPFEWQEMRRYGWSWMTLKFAILRVSQSRTFRHADGLVFLSRYAHDVVTRAVGSSKAKTRTIPHGIDGLFVCPPRAQVSIDQCSHERPFRILYVSTIDVYKHQWHVAEAVTQLRANGLPVVLELVGPAYPPALKRLRRTLASIDPSAECVGYTGAVPFSELHLRYVRADLCVFASSCESMPNSLLEGMASGLPIACSNRGPMPEVLGEGGVYFKPTDTHDIARALRELIDSPEMRLSKAKASFSRAQSFSWSRCAAETFEFIAGLAKENHHHTA